MAFVSGRYKGTCHNCGIQGHKAQDCRRGNGNGNANLCGNQRRGGRGQNQNGPRNSGNNNHNSGSRITCNYCKIKGHKEAECRKKLREDKDRALIAAPGQTRNTNQFDYDFSLVSVPLCGLVGELPKGPTQDTPLDFDLDSAKGVCDFLAISRSLKTK